MISVKSFINLVSTLFLICVCVYRSAVFGFLGANATEDDLPMKPVVRYESGYKIPLYYIFVDKLNRTNTVLPEYLQTMFSDVSDHFFGEVEIIVHNYITLQLLFDEFDPEMARYFSLINPMYAALLSDIGRYLLLYLYGGIYHDTKMRFEDLKEIIKFSELCEPQQQYLILEIHPTIQQRIRNSNMIACRRGSRFLFTVMEMTKIDLRKMVLGGEIPNKYSGFGRSMMIDLIKDKSSCAPRGRGGLRRRLYSFGEHLFSPDDYYRGVECAYGEERFLCQAFNLHTYADVYHAYNGKGENSTHWSTITEPLLLLSHNETGLHRKVDH